MVWEKETVLKLHVDPEYKHFFLIWLMLTAIFYFSDSRRLLYLYSLQLYHYTADIMLLYIYLQYGANCVRICSVIFTSIAHKRVIFGNIWRSRVAARDQPNPGRSFTW